MKTLLLKCLKDLTEEVTKDILLPVVQQKGDAEPLAPRAPNVYRMRVPDGTAATKKAPYILHQIVTGKDTQAAGKRLPDSVASVRSIFCVYHKDEQEGGLALLELMERMRIAFLERGIIGTHFWLDETAELETLIYPDNTAPYFAGEMFSVWHLPPIKRLDAAKLVRIPPAYDPKLNSDEETTS